MTIISKDLSKAITLLNNEELVAIPTETVYGLAGNIYSEKAIKAIFKTKQRPFFNPLIVHIPSVEKLSEVVDHIPEKAKLLAKKFWPGPITLVLKKKASIPDLITAKKDTVAVRVPNHPITLELLNQLNVPLAAPSANPFGSISPTRAQHVEMYFKNKIKMVLNGGICKKGIESTIIGFNKDTPIIYRLGSISLEAIEAVVGKIKIKDKLAALPNAPGMLERHYAPKIKMILTDSIQKELEKFKNKRIGLLTFYSEFSHKSITFQFQLSKAKSLTEAASKLYVAMHQLDNENVDIIIAEEFPNINLGRSINDRLRRATK